MVVADARYTVRIARASPERGRRAAPSVVGWRPRIGRTPPDDDAARPARRGRHALRRAAARSRLRRDDGTTSEWSFRELAAAQPDRGVAAAGAGPRARRPHPDLVAVHARAPGRVLRRDGRAARARPARPADVAAGGRGHRPGVGSPAPDPRAPAATRRTRARPASTTSRRRPSRRSRAEPDAGRPGVPARLGGAPGAPGSGRPPTRSSSSSSPRARPARRRA